MCFSNLPLEFDEQGNPYLAEEAEDIERPSTDTDDSNSGSVTEETIDADLATDPEGAYEAIVASLPTDARKHVGPGDRETMRAHEDAPESAESD